VPGMNDPEMEGGDPPCWAHLFDEEMYGMAIDNETQDRKEVSGGAAPRTGAAEMVELAALAHAVTTPGAAWTRQSEDLDVNLLVFPAGQGVAEHLNTEVDVLLVGVVGEGVVDVDGKCHILRAGHALVIPKGANRGTRSLSDPFAYLSCHRRRGGLRPGG
jgi:quercetin dioxygenase-like cupin family protein